MADLTSLVKDFRALGIRPGMDLLVHSSLRRLGPVEGGADTVIDALLEVLGPEGTLMMSTVSGNVTENQPVFDVRHTPSTVGTLSNVFLKREGVIRSLHPVHSVAALGPRAEFFTGGHLECSTPWSPGSPYGKLMRNKGFILFLGTNFTCNTCIHALEIEARVPGLHTRETSPLYIHDYEGNVRVIQHHWHAPKKDFFVDMEHVVEAAGGLKWGRTGTGLSRLVDAEILRASVLPILKSTPKLVIMSYSKDDFIWEP